MSKTTTVGAGDKKVSIGQIGHGLMLMTWKPTPVPDEQCFESIKASLDSVPAGTKMLINSGEFYGIDPKEANLELLARFFEKYPEYAEKAFLSVKGGNISHTYESLKSSVDNILSRLRGTKHLDLFECARIDSTRPIEDTIEVLAGFVAERKFDYIGMSECNAQTLRRAYAVHPIAIVEIEVSPWSYDHLVKDVIATTKELGTVVAAYSPLGSGFLAGKFNSIKELDQDDIRSNLDRFQEENIENNKRIADGLAAIAQGKGVTPAQLCIAWVCARGTHVVPIPGSSHKTRTLENMAAADIKLSEAELKAIDKLLEENPVKGLRYNKEHQSLLMQ